MLHVVQTTGPCCMYRPLDHVVCTDQWPMLHVQISGPCCMYRPVGHVAQWAMLHDCHVV